MARWLGSVSSGAAVILLSRWLLRLGHPADDWRRVVATLARPWTALRERVRAVWRAYGPVTAEMRAAWLRLRQRHHSGFYGVEGT